MQGQRYYIALGVSLLDSNELKQVHNLIIEIIEDEKRQYTQGFYSLIEDEAYINTCKIKAKEIAQSINAIPDSLVRRALKLRYLDNLPWSYVAIRMGYSSEAGPRNLCYRFFNK